jgi:hypothetical protein
MKKVILFVSVTVLFIVSCTFEKYEVPKVTGNGAAVCDSTVHFYPTIYNLLNDASQCGNHNCHGATSALPYVSRGNVASTYSLFKPHVDNGSVLTRVVNLQGNPMPASGPIADSLRSQLRCWIQQGALNN